MEEYSRLRLPSDFIYYPTIQELLKAESDDVASFNKAKNILECLIRETLSQLNESNKQERPTTEFVQERRDFEKHT